VPLAPSNEEMLAKAIPLEITNVENE